MLEFLGLTKYEEMAYITLLKKGCMNAEVLSKESGVPLGKIYHTLSKLAEKGLIKIIPQRPKLFEAVDPKIAIQTLIEIRKKYLEKEGELAIKKLSTYPSNKPIIEGVRVVYGQTLYRLVDEWYRSASLYLKRAFTFDSLPRRIMLLQKIAIKRGVKIMLLATQIDKRKVKLIQKCKKLGIEVRYFPLHELRIVIVDGKIGMIGVMNPSIPGQRIGIISESKEFCKAIEGYFDYLWRGATIV